MSGIFGWSNFGLEPTHDQTQLQGMANALLINPNLQTLTQNLAFCSLGAAGNSNKFGWQHRDGIALVYHGQIAWKDKELEGLAQTKGIAESLIAAYLRHGPKLLERTKGGFSLALFDEARKSVLCAIDKLGRGSLFYTVIQNQLIFSSNAKSLKSHPSITTNLDPQSLYDYLYFHMVPGPRSIYQGFEKLLPGEYLFLENGKMRKAFYWTPDYSEPCKQSFEDLKHEFRTVLKDAVAQNLDDSKLGSFLSGGTDSSTIAGLIRELTGKPGDNFTIGFDAEGYDEMEFARITANHFKTTLHEHYISPQDVVDAIPLIARAYDEPFGNASAIPTYFCAKFAKQDGFDTLLAGDGGDELFGGNERYAKQKKFELYFNLPSVLRKGLIEPTLLNLPLDSIKLLGKAKSYVQQARTPLPDRLESYNFLNRLSQEEIFASDFLGSINREDPIQLLRSTYARGNQNSSLDRMLYSDWKFTLADSDLRKVNRMSELAGIEVRYPMLEDEVLEFSIKLPPELKIKGFQLRYFFKQALSDFLPQATLTKSKQGFGLPFGVWMNSYAPLREIAYQSLSDFSKRGIINPAFIDQLKKLHSEHPNYYGVFIWVLMMLEQWLRYEES